MVKVASLLLAGGQSRRMNGANKLLQDLDGKTVLERVCSEIASAGFSEIVAVTGFESSRVSRALSLFPFKIILNQSFENGMHSSIRAGVEVLGDCDFFAVCLGDQPFLSSDDYAVLIEAADANPQAKLIYPVIDGERGQPVLISASLRDEILAHADDDKGCQYLFARYGGLAVDLTYSASALAFYDVDTPEALSHARHAWIGAQP